ncbi:hypothetical protein TRICI_001798 [Trichomonascus ciferrii]|uniref:Uncharacterized protein n=1 Tax=Trichomonascus ciferrii TaxID=44093 RepID=A0A642V9U4_9ASCO|nr:hypothetical protein TRICI_001798 [Trichomonascus ciferrii]
MNDESERQKEAVKPPSTPPNNPATPKPQIDSSSPSKRTNSNLSPEQFAELGSNLKNRLSSALKKLKTTQDQMDPNTIPSPTKTHLSRSSRVGKGHRRTSSDSRIPITPPQAISHSASTSNIRPSTAPRQSKHKRRPLSISLPAPDQPQPTTAQTPTKRRSEEDEAVQTLMYMSSPRAQQPPKFE